MTHEFCLYIFFLSLSVRFCPFWYGCYYSHTSRDSLSPIAGFFLPMLLSVLLLFTSFAIAGGGVPGSVSSKALNCPLISNIGLEGRGVVGLLSHIQQTHILTTPATMYPIFQAKCCPETHSCCFSFLECAPPGQEFPCMQRTSTKPVNVTYLPGYDLRPGLHPLNPTTKP